MPSLSSNDSITRAELDITLVSIAEMENKLAIYQERYKTFEGLQLNPLQQVKNDLQKKHLRKEIKETETSKQAFESAALRLKCLLAPIRLLPAELLLRVFRIVLLDMLHVRIDCNVRWMATSFDPTLIRIGQVCSQWRLIVHQNASLWELVLLEMRVPWDRDPELRVLKTTRRVGLYKSQGRQGAQSVFIEHWRYDTQFLEVTHALGSSATPWKSIDLGLMDCRCTGEWDVESVCAKEVTIYRRSPQASLAFFMPLLRYATTLAIFGTPPLWGTTPWTSLRTLKIHPFTRYRPETCEPISFDAAEFRDLLIASPFLKQLELDFVAMRSGTNAEPRHRDFTLEHQFLNSLSVYLSHFAAHNTPFGVRLIAPSLKTLKILSFGDVSSADIEASVKCWDQPTTLSLCKFNEQNIPTVIRLLHRLPNLTTLIMQGQNTDKLFICINGFYQGYHTTVPLGRLTTISLDVSDIQGLTLVELLKARLDRCMDAISPIIGITLRECGRVTPEEWKQINELLERGRAGTGGYSRSVLV